MNKPRNGFLRFLGGTLRGIDITRKVVIDVIFLAIVVFVLIVIFTPNAPPVPATAALKLDLKGTLVEETPDPVRRAMRKLIGQPVTPVTEMRNIEAALRTAALIAPDIALTRMLYGAYLAREGLVAEALKELEVASKLDPDDAQIAYELGVARYLVEDVDGAIDSMADAVRLNPEDGWPRSVLGLVLLEAERFEEAAGELSEAAHHRPEDVEIQAAAALAAGIIENDALAYEMLERARIRADEGDTDLLLAAEDRLDAGPEPCRTFLMDEVAPELLRRRLQERP